MLDMVELTLQLLDGFLWNRAGLFALPDLTANLMLKLRELRVDAQLCQCAGHQPG